MSEMMAEERSAVIFDVVYTPWKDRYLRTVPVLYVILFMIVASALSERLANFLTGSLIVRVISLVLAIVLVWRWYMSHVARLVLSDTTLELTCTKDVVTHALSDIAVVSVFTRSKNGGNTITITRHSSRCSRRFHTVPRFGDNALIAEQQLIDAFRARGINVRRPTIVLW
jgi:hypothetical protein